MLIRARTPVGIERPAAVLHIDALGAPLIVGLGQQQSMMARLSEPEKLSLLLSGRSSQLRYR
jgi:hypothetical protein